MESILWIFMPGNWFLKPISPLNLTPISPTNGFCLTPTINNKHWLVTPGGCRHYHTDGLKMTIESNWLPYVTKLCCWLPAITLFSDSAFNLLPCFVGWWHWCAAVSIKFVDIWVIVISASAYQLVKMKQWETLNPILFVWCDFFWSTMTRLIGRKLRSNLQTRQSSIAVENENWESDNDAVGCGIFMQCWECMMNTVNE